MKELSIEEKAKAYDEVLERAREEYEIYKGIKDVYHCEALERIFHKLAESTDERIRKALIKWFESYSGQNLEWYDGLTPEKAISWLEKQGEQKSVIVPKFRVGDIIRWKKADSVEYTIKEINDKGYINTADGIMNIYQTDIEFELVGKKPVELNQEDENVRKDLINFIYGVFQGSHTVGAEYERDRYVAYLEKQGEQKPEWSEEDENMMNNLIQHLKVAYSQCDWLDETIDWLESLKDRVQPKQELSEEDEAVLDALIRRLEGEDVYVSPHLAVECLKSLRPQKQWKPSEKQIEAIRIAAEVGTANDSWAMAVLKELHKQLKAL